MGVYVSFHTSAVWNDIVPHLIFFVNAFLRNLYGITTFFFPFSGLQAASTGKPASAGTIFAKRRTILRFPQNRPAFFVRFVYCLFSDNEPFAPRDGQPFRPTDISFVNFSPR